MIPNAPNSLSRRQALIHGLGLVGASVLVASCSSSTTASTAGSTPGSPADSSVDQPAVATGVEEPDTSATSAATDGAVEPAPSGVALRPTAACADDDEPTIERTEGPFFSTGSPERTNFREADETAGRFILEGVVTDTSCTPIGGAKIELWHADTAGQYDNSGYRYRGHFFTEADGTYRVETVKAGLYPGRTRHFHFKVQPEGGNVLTSQLFWPDEPDNAGDDIFDDSLVMDIAVDGDAETGTFHVVL